MPASTNATPRILAELKEFPRSVAELTERLGIAKTTVLQHLRPLIAKGTVFRQGGQPCYYALDPADFWKLVPRS